MEQFFWALFYNGHEQEVEKLMCKLDDSDRFSYAESDLEYQDDSMMQALYMVLVMKFGDYGTSPRSGWIDDTDAAARFLFDGIGRSWGFGKDVDMENMR